MIDRAFYNQIPKPMIKTQQDYINDINVQRQKPLNQQVNDIIAAVAQLCVAIDNYTREKS